MKKFYLLSINLFLVLFSFTKVNAQVVPQVTFDLVNLGKIAGCDIEVTIETCWCDEDANGECISGTEQCNTFNSQVIVPFCGDLIGPNCRKQITTPAAPPGKKVMYNITFKGINPASSSVLNPVTITLPNNGESINLGSICGEGTNPYTVRVDGFNLTLTTTP